MGLGRYPAIAVWLAFALASASGSQAQTMDELYASGVKARQEQRFDEAAGLLKRALALKPDNADALVQLGFAELGRGDLPAARDAFSRALALAPNYADAKFGLAEIEFRSGKLDAALAIVEPLAREQPDNGEFAGLLANIRKAEQAKRASPAKTTPLKAAQKPGKPKAGRQAARPDPVSILLAQDAASAPRASWPRRNRDTARRSG
jgi:tetratricopeptide (TPR) repeat protein